MQPVEAAPKSQESTVAPTTLPGAPTSNAASGQGSQTAIEPSVSKWLGMFHAQTFWAKLRLPHPVVGVPLAVLLFALMLCSTRFHCSNEGVQLSARSELAILQLETDLQVNGLRVAGLSIRGVSRLEFPGRSGDVPVRPDETFRVLTRAPAPSEVALGASSSSWQPAGTSVPPSITNDETIGLAVFKKMQIRIEHHPEEAAEMYSLSAEGGANGPARLDLVMQDGQALVGRTTRLGEDAESGLPITLFADQGTLDLDFLVRSKRSLIPPMDVSGLDFNEETTKPTSGAGMWASRLLGAEVAFIDVPDKVTTIRQGGILSFSGLRGTIHSLELDSVGISMTLTGEVNSVRITISHTARELVPNWFESAVNSDSWRFAAGSAGILWTVWRWANARLIETQAREAMERRTQNASAESNDGQGRAPEPKS